jgi:DNA-binding transcriptional LysR family regulator
MVAGFVDLEGEDLLPRSRRLLTDAESLGERARALKTGHNGVLRVRATPQVIECLLVDFLAQHQRRHPGVEVHLIEGGPHHTTYLERGEVHLAIMPAGDDRFDRRLLYPNHLLAVLARTHRLSRRPVLDILELADDPWLLLGRGFASRDWFTGASVTRAHHTARTSKRRCPANADRVGSGRVWHRSHSRWCSHSA